MARFSGIVASAILNASFSKIQCGNMRRCGDHNSLHRKKNARRIEERKTNAFVLRHRQTNCCMVSSGTDRKGGHDVSSS
jgi:hypothetical protein